MTQTEEAYLSLCIAVWSLGLQIALERLGEASSLFTASAPTNPFLPLLSLPSEGQGATLH